MKTSLVDQRAVERLLLLVAAVRSGLVDALADGALHTATDVAELAGADPRASHVVLEALAAEQVVERVGEGSDPLYRLTETGAAHLLEGGSETERAGLLHQANKLRGWLELPEVIRSGGPLSKGASEPHVRNRALAMGERDPAVLAEIVERCLAYAGTVTTMIDIGGSVGHLAREFSRLGVKTTLFDSDEVIAIAKEYLGSEAEDMELLAGDYTVALPRGPFDLVYFGNVLHIYGPETNARAAQQAFAATERGGVVAIQDYVWGRSPRSPLFAVNMLRSTKDGGVWTEGQYRGWLGSAGYSDVEVLDLENAEAQLILGRRPGGAA